MEILRWKTRIAFLWVCMAVAMLAHMVLLIVERGGLEWVIPHWEEMGAAALLIDALFWWIPLVMAFLSMTLKDSANRWTNFILGIVITVFNIFQFFEPCIGARIDQIVTLVIALVATALIAWYAWKWPKSED